MSVRLWHTISGSLILLPSIIQVGGGFFFKATHVRGLFLVFLFMNSALFTTLFRCMVFMNDVPPAAPEMVDELEGRGAHWVIVGFLSHISQSQPYFANNIRHANMVRSGAGSH